jgi:hypothetical protein
MSKVKVLAGDFLKGDGSYGTAFGIGLLTLRTEKHRILGETIRINELASVTIANEESVKTAGGTIGWGVAGALALGPAGLLAGLLLGGKSKEVTFVAVFNDGRKMMATTDSATYTKLLAGVF